MISLASVVLSVALQGSMHAPRRTDAPVRQEVAEGWDDLSPGQRDRALRNYQHYRELPAEKRRDIDQHYEKWKKLPRSDQDRFRKKHDEYRGMGLVGD